MSRKALSIVVAVVLVLIAAGHFVPIEKDSFGSACLVSKHDYRVLLGQKKNYDSYKKNVLIRGADVGCTGDATLKLYLW